MVKQQPTVLWRSAGYDDKDQKSFEILRETLVKRYGISDKEQLDAMWTRLVNCKKRTKDFLLKLQNGQQYNNVDPFVSAWKLEWEQKNKENGTGNTKLPRCDASAPFADVHLNLKSIIVHWDVDVADMWCMGPGYKDCTNMLPGSSPPLDLFCVVVQLSCWIML